MERIIPNTFTHQEQIRVINRIWDAIQDMGGTPSGVPPTGRALPTGTASTTPTPTFTVQQNTIFLVENISGSIITDSEGHAALVPFNFKSVV